MKQTIKAFFQKLDILMLIRFGLVGVLNTAVDFGTFFVLNTLLGVDVYVSQTSSFLLSTVNSFLWNKYWTFGKHTTLRGREIFRFVCAQGSYLLISLAVMFFWNDMVHLPPMVAKVLTAGMMIGYNYIIDKLWVFK